MVLYIINMNVFCKALGNHSLYRIFIYGQNRILTSWSRQRVVTRQNYRKVIIIIVYLLRNGSFKMTIDNNRLPMADIQNLTIGRNKQGLQCGSLWDQHVHHQCFTLASMEVCRKLETTQRETQSGELPGTTQLKVYPNLVKTVVHQDYP